MTLKDIFEIARRLSKVDRQLILDQKTGILEDSKWVFHINLSNWIKMMENDHIL